MPNIIVNGKAFTFDKIIYADGVNGLDANDGLSELTPVKTLTKANTLSTNSNTSCIYLLGGEFTASALAINGCLIGKSGKFPIITYSAPSEWGAGIVFNTPNSTITGVIFKATGGFGNRYHFNTNGAGITIGNCVFYNFITTRRWFAYTNEVVIKNCYFGQDYTPTVLNAHSGGYNMSGNLFKTESDVNEIYYPINPLYQNVGVYSGELAWSMIKLLYILNTNYINSKNDILTLKLLGIQPSAGITPDLNSFKIKINNEILYENPITSSYPQSINIPLSLLNTLSSINFIEASLNGGVSISDIIYYEGDGLLNPITRDFKNYEIGDKSNVALIPYTGISLTNQNRQGSVFTDISVYKKAEVKKVTVDGDTDKVITGNFTFKPNFIDTYFYKNVITRPFGSKFTKMTYLKPNTDVLYMVPNNVGDIGATDGNDATGAGIGSNGAIKFYTFEPSYIKYIRYIRNEGSTLLFYDKNNTLVLSTPGPANGTYMLVDLHDITKIECRAGTWSLGVSTLEAIGYNYKSYSIYSNPKYNIYSPISALISTLVLEDFITPTKDLVKSKKMGNLAFINNPSKVIVKKTSTSSNQTSSKIVRNKIDLANIPMRKIEVK